MVDQTASACSLLRNNVVAMKGYTPGEQVNDCLKLNTNECAWPPSPAVADTLAHYQHADLRRYPQPTSDTLRACAATLWGHPADGILIGNGSDDCLTILYRAFCNPNDSVAVPWPTYGLYDTLAAIQGIKIEHVAWKADWQLPTDALLATDAKMILLANPNNPSGGMVAASDLKRLATEFQGILVVDEAYIDFAESGSSFLKELTHFPRTVILRTCSKSYSLAAARIGFLLADPELIQQLNKVKDSYNVNAISQAIGVAALEDRAYHTSLIEQSLASRAALAQALQRFGWTWPQPQANFLLCQVGPEAEHIYLALKKQGILVRWWNTEELRTHLRITVGTPEENQRLLQALDEIISV